MRKKTTDTRTRSQNKHQILFVQGMHCASCEVLIEKSVLETDSVQSVDASIRNGSVDIEYASDKELDINALNKRLKPYGYTLMERMQEPRQRTKWSTIVGLALVVIIVIYGVFRFQLGKYASVDNTSSLPAFFLLGVVAGLSSCAALIGGLLLSMTKRWNARIRKTASRGERAIPHIMFHAGRLISFAILGGLLGLLGEAIAWNNPTVFAVLTLVVSAVMFILALQMLEVRWAQKLRFRAPSFITRYATDDRTFRGKAMPFLTGVLTFFLPCGFTLVAQTTALASGSMARGGAIMMLFALGTLPTLAGISVGSVSFTVKPKNAALFNKVAGVIVLVFVLVNANGQFNVLGWPSVDGSSEATRSPDEIADRETPTDEDPVSRQTLAVTATGFEYTPTSSTTLRSGVPTTLVVDNQGIEGCGAALLARGLLKNIVILQPGKNEIDLGSPKKGTYKITCSMGMVSPVTVTVQ